MWASLFISDSVKDCQMTVILQCDALHQELLWICKCFVPFNTSDDIL